MEVNKEKVDELIEKFSKEKGQSREEVIRSFEAVLDKFCADGEKGKQALKFLGFEERPSVEEFIAAMAGNAQLMKLIRK